MASRSPRPGLPQRDADHSSDQVLGAPDRAVDQLATGFPYCPLPGTDPSDRLSDLRPLDTPVPSRLAIHVDAMLQR